MLFHGGCTCHHGKCGTAVIICGEDSGAASCCGGVVTGTSSGSPGMDATSFLYTTLAIRKVKYPLIIDRKQAMINAIEAKLQT